MRCRDRQSALKIALTALLFLVETRPALSDSTERRDYRVDCEVDMVVELRTGKKEAVKGKARFDYTLTPIQKGEELSILVSMSELSLDTTSQPTSKFRMNHEALLDERNGQAAHIKRADASAKVLEMLDTFGPTLATITVNAEGAELGRTVSTVVGPLSQPGMIQNARFFHIRFPKDNDAWDVDVSLPMGQGRTAEGTVHCSKKKRPDEADLDEPVLVSVAGELKTKAAIQGIAVSGGQYTVSGDQTYDPKLGDWSRGSWTVKTDLQMEKDGKPYAKMTGGLKLTLAQRLKKP